MSFEERLQIIWYELSNVFFYNKSIDNRDENLNLNLNPMYDMMGLKKRIFVLIFQMKKILFYLQIWSFSWLYRWHSIRKGIFGIFV
jgi:hypothetical protein